VRTRHHRLSAWARAQSISVGNLGSLAIRQGDHGTAKPCMEQHLQLVQVRLVSPLVVARLVFFFLFGGRCQVRLVSLVVALLVLFV